MPDPVKRAIFDGLVRRLGGVEAAASVLEARYGGGWKGTISKICNGQLSVNMDAAEAIEDAVGAFPLTNRMFERTGREGVRRGCLKDLAALSTVASGQAHAALIRAHSPMSDGAEDMTAEERAEVIAEMRAARQALTDIIDAAEATA
jgi:hypothetical protein